MLSSLETRSPRRSQPSSRASQSEDWLRGEMPRTAARLGVDIHEPESKSQTASVPPQYNSESAKKRKAKAQARGNATQPGPLPPSKRQKGTRDPDSTLDRLYTDLEDEEECREWLYQALEFRNPRTNYRQRLDLGVEELEEIFKDEEANDGARRVNSGIRIGPAKILKKDHAAKRLTVQLDPLKPTKPTSRPTHAHHNPKLGPTPSGRVPPPVSALVPPTNRSQKPAPIPNAPHPSVKFSRAQVQELRRKGSNGRPSVATNHNGTNSPRNALATSKPTPWLRNVMFSAPGPVRHTNASRVATSDAPTRVSSSPNPTGNGQDPLPTTAAETETETEEAPVAKPKKNTKKEMAQLRYFGEARPIVKLVVEWIKVEMIVTCPFPELLPSEDEADAGEGDDSPPPCRSLFDDWVDRFWDRAHAKIRRGKPPIDRKEPHEYYMRLQLSRLRNHVKGTCFGKIMPSYQITRGNPRDVNRALDLINDDKFLSPHLANDTHRFKHEIISETIQEAFFDGSKDLGSKYKTQFLPLMPKVMLAFVACINDDRSKSLDAGEDYANFERYLTMMEDMEKKNQGTRLSKLRGKILEACLMGCAGPTVQETAIEWDEDSEPDEGQEGRIKTLAGEVWDKAARQKSRSRHDA